MWIIKTSLLILFKEWYLFIVRIMQNT